MPAAAPREGDDVVVVLVGEVSEEKEDVLPPMPGLAPLPLRVEVGDNTEGWLLKPALTEV